MLLRLYRVEPLRGSPLSYAVLGVVALPAPPLTYTLCGSPSSYRGGIVALLALRFTYIHILSIAVAILRHFMLSSP